MALFRSWHALPTRRKKCSDRWDAAPSVFDTYTQLRVTFVRWKLLQHEVDRDTGILCSLIYSDYCEARAVTSYMAV